MRLSSKDKKVLSAIGQIGDAPISKLRKLTGIRDHTIRYTLDKLTEQEIIRPFTFVNVAPLGYTAFSLYLSLAPDQSKEHSVFLKELMASPNVPWVAEFVGNYQYGTTIYAKNLPEFLEITSEIAKKTDVKIADKTFRLDVGLEYFPLKAFVESGSKPARIIWGHNVESAEIDSTDAKILSALSQRVAHSGNDLARALKLAPSTVHERLEKLKRKGIISAVTYFFNPEKAALQTFKVFVTTYGLGREFAKTLGDFCHAHPKVSLLVHVLGAWDYEINIDLDDPVDVNAFTKLLSETFPNSIRQLQVMRLLRHLKVANFPFNTFGTVTRADPKSIAPKFQPPLAANS